MLKAVSGLIAIGAGAYLLQTQAAGDDSFLEVIAHGMGAYFVAKGLFIWATLSEQERATGLLARIAGIEPEADSPSATPRRRRPIIVGAVIVGVVVVVVLAQTLFALYG
jgi:hypothetical protein